MILNSFVVWCGVWEARWIPGGYLRYDLAKDSISDVFAGFASIIGIALSLDTDRRNIQGSPF